MRRLKTIWRDFWYEHVGMSRSYGNGHSGYWKFRTGRLWNVLVAVAIILLFIAYLIK